MLSCRGATVSSLVRADQFEGIRGPHEGRAERHLLHHWREHRRRVLFLVLENFAQDGSRGSVHGLTPWMGMPCNS